MRLGLIASAIALPGLLYLGNPAVALLVGAAICLVSNQPVFAAASQLSMLTLQAAIVLLGFRLSVDQIASIGADYGLLVSAYVVLTLAAGFGLGFLFRNTRNSSLLVASGTAICGGTAIASLSPVIGAKPGECGVALTLVFLLNAVALLAFPLIGDFAGLSQNQFGVWAALAIHDTSSVVATSAIYGDEAVLTATTVKLGRTLWLIPLMLGVSLYFGKSKKGVQLPLFIVAFVLAAASGSLITWPAAWLEIAATASKALLVVALFLVGTQIDRTTLKGLRGATLWQGVVLWLVVAPAVLAWVIYAVP